MREVQYPLIRDQKISGWAFGTSLIIAQEYISGCLPYVCDILRRIKIGRYENGRTTRHDFASKEECQAFVASLTEKDKSGDVNAEAEARAEHAAASLLAELSIDSSRCAQSKKKGKKKGKEMS